MQSHDNSGGDSLLLHSEKQLHALLENMLEGFAYCRVLFENNRPQDVLCLEVNSAFERLTGLKDVVGKKASTVIPGIHESYPELLETFARVALGGRPEKFELYVKQLDAWLSFSAYAPAREHVVAVFENVTDKKRSDQDARFHASIIQNIPDAVCSIDLQGLTTSWNRGAERMLGYAPNEIIGRPITMIIPAELAQGELEHCLTLLNKDGSFTGYESVRLARDGRRIPVELTGVAVKDSAGTVRNYASIMVDITGRRKTEEERLKGHMLESVGILAGGIAHDYNNLLQAISGNIHLAKMFVQPDNKAFARLADAEQICDMGSELSKRLLIFARGGDPVRRSMRMTDLVKSTARAALKGSPISLELDLPKDLYPVLIDEGQLRQVVANLVSNAREAMPKGGALTVQGMNLSGSARDSLPMQEGNYVRISFMDTGAGIPSGDLARIFDPYYSTKDTYSQKGLGLGLAVCYSIIKKHDGLITAESQVGKGTTFHVYLPAAGNGASEVAS